MVEVADKVNMDVHEHQSAALEPRDRESDCQQGDSSFAEKVLSFNNHTKTHSVAMPNKYDSLNIVHRPRTEVIDPHNQNH